MTQLWVEVFKGFVKPREGKGGRSSHDDQVSHDSGPRPFPAAKGVPSQFHIAPKPSNRTVWPEGQAIIGEQMLPASSHLSCQRFDARLNHMLRCLTQNICPGKCSGFPSIRQPEIPILLPDLVV